MGSCLKLDIYIVVCASLALLSAGLIASNFLLAPMLRFIRAARGTNAALLPRTVSSISIIVPAYNEEHNIENKIDTLRLALQRVDVEVEVIIGSDGSKDRTVEIIKARLKDADLQNWRLLEFVNEGKCSTLNKLVAAARGEIIISTDADIPLPENSIELVVSAFRANTRLGCLSCIPWFEGMNIGSQKTYWSIEDQIRRSESALGRLIVVTGMLYAYRRELFEKIPDGVMADDLWVPLNVLIKGYESVQVEDLRVPYEKTDEQTEIVRRKRVIVGGMDVVRRLWSQLVSTPSLLFLVLFHKINRWALPVWLCLFLAAVAVLIPWIIVGYLAGAVFVYWYLGRERFFRFGYAAISPVLSFAEVLGKTDFARWEHTRKH